MKLKTWWRFLPKSWFDRKAWVILLHARMYLSERWNYSITNDEFMAYNKAYNILKNAGSSMKWDKVIRNIGT